MMIRHPHSNAFLLIDIINVVFFLTHDKYFTLEQVDQSIGINSSKPYRCYRDHHYPFSNPWTTWLSFVPKFKSILSCKITLQTTKSRPPIRKQDFYII